MTGANPLTSSPARLGGRRVFGPHERSTSRRPPLRKTDSGVKNLGFTSGKLGATPYPSQARFPKSRQIMNRLF